MADNANTEVKSFIAVWLDSNINNNEENRKAQVQLRSFINRLKIFENINECEKYVRSTSEQLILIVNGRLGRELVPKIHPLRHVASIYVYCADKEGNEQWAKHFSKIKGVITRLNELLSQIRLDQESSYSGDQISTKSTPNSNDKMDEKFLSLAYTHLLSCVLVQMKESATAKSELVSVCKEYYQNNHSELENITLFQKTYSSDKAIYWYTSYACMYGMLGKALRTQDTDMIFLFQFFIRDIHQQLLQLQCEHHIKVYRAQSMPDDVLNNFKESVGRLIGMHSIFSTTLKREIALQFLSTGNYSNNSQRVLFEIDAEPKAMATKPFGDISKDSAFTSEDEVLFAYGCFFRVIDVQQNGDQIWIVRMMLCGDNHDNVREVLTGIRERFGSSEGEGALFAFIRVLCAMKKFDEAEKYCERLLQQFSSEESALATIYGELAKIALNKNNSALHAQWTKKLMKIQKKVGSSYADNSTAIGNSNSKIITAKTQHG